MRPREHKATIATGVIIDQTARMSGLRNFRAVATFVALAVSGFLVQVRNITVASGYGMRNWWDPGEPFPEPPEPQPSSLGPGIFSDATVFDAMDISGTNLMIDHVNTLYATDETISMNEAADNITVQYSNIAQGKNYPQWDAEGPGRFTGHALGSLLEAGSGAAISFHHNLYAHFKGRVPQAQGANAYYEFRNNVFYNWFGTAGADRHA